MIDAFGNDLLRRGYEKWRYAVTLFAAMSRRETVKVCILSIVPHLFETAAFVVLGSALGIILDFSTWGWVRPTVVLMTMLPLSFAGLGVREVSLIVLLATYDVPAEQAVALAVSLFAISVLLPAVPGVVSETIDLFGHVRMPHAKTR
jgi:uncharacterized membrane protein YbhN (UPF0104 family)